MQRTLNIIAASIACSICLLLHSCVDRIVIDTSEFIVEEHHTIELVAAEPDVILPVAIAEDGQNRFWVVEMPGYMRDIDGSNEELPDGRIVILSDTNKDGKIDSRKIFLDSLENPRAICFVNDGVMYSDGTQLKWSEITDDIPGNTIVVDSFYVVGGNIEHQPNGLLYNIDNWIYSAKSNARYQYRNGIWKKEATTFRGQWGISMDKSGRLIYNHNSAPLISDYSIPNQNLDNPFLKLEHSTGRYLTDEMRIFPMQATAVNRGYQPEVLDSAGKVVNYTSACAPHIYYGAALDQLFQGSAFVCAPEGNLISNYAYNENTLEATRSLGQNEFLISSDESFRPVNLMTGFDGSLVVVDMRKGIIQHSAYMSSYLREKILTKGLDKINGKGRIYRIRSKDETPKQPKTHDLSSEDLINLFHSSNLQLRIFAQKKLIAKNDKSDIPLLLSMASNSENSIARCHALWTLEGMEELSADHIAAISNLSLDPDLIAQLIILSKGFPNDFQRFEELYKKALRQDSKHIHFLLASVAGRQKQYEDIWLQLAHLYNQDPIICESLVSSIEGRESYFLSRVNRKEHQLLTDMIDKVIVHKVANEIQSPTLVEKPFDDDRTNGLKIFKTYCVSCHGYDGKGLKNQAPSLTESAIIDGDEKEIASIVLNGYTSANSDYQVVMPAYKDDKNLSDQDIVDLISYLKSTFTSDWNSLGVKDVEGLRE